MGEHLPKIIESADVQPVVRRPIYHEPPTFEPGSELGALWDRVHGIIPGEVVSNPLDEASTDE